MADIAHYTYNIIQHESAFYKLTEKALLLSCTITFKSMSTMFCLEGIPGGGFLQYTKSWSMNDFNSQMYLTMSGTYSNSTASKSGSSNAYSTRRKNT